MKRRTLLSALVAAGAASAASSPRTARARTRRVPPPEAVGMLYDATRCIGCKACVVKCREANDLPPTRSTLGTTYDAPLDLDATTKTVIKLYKEDGRSSFVKSQCMHCVDPACASVCMLGAFKKEANGTVSYDRDLCIGCRYCQIACPFGIPKFEWDTPTPLIVKCEMCRHLVARGRKPACVEVCPREAIVFGKLADLKLEARRRLAEDPKRYHPAVYGETEAGGTQVLYLAGAAIGFEKLGLPTLGEDAVPDLSETIQHGIYQGFVAPAALYAALGVVVLRNRKKQKEEEEKEAGQ